MAELSDETKEILRVHVRAAVLAERELNRKRFEYLEKYTPVITNLTIDKAFPEFRITLAKRGFVTGKSVVEAIDRAIDAETLTLREGADE